MRTSALLAGIVALVGAFALGKAMREPHVPAATFAVVPNEEIATQVAVAALAPIYGRENIERQKPFRAALSGDVWTVEGSLPPGFVGGVAIAEISKADGHIIRMTHGK